MLVKLAVLGGLGYAGYKYYQRASGAQRAPRVALAGGPLSSHAQLRASGDEPPSAQSYAEEGAS